MTTDALMLLTLLVLLAVAAGVLVLLVRVGVVARERSASEQQLRALASQLEVLKAQQADLERDLKQDFRMSRVEQQQAAHGLREEVGDRVSESKNRALSPA